ncbi:hypothetical protein BH20ACI1_BH20ACI1_23650 [soil metagenome]
MLNEAKDFAEIESVYAEPSLFGVTDGKAVGTYIKPLLSGIEIACFENKRILTAKHAKRTRKKEETLSILNFGWQFFLYCSVL